MATLTVTDWPSFITAVGTAGADVEFPHTSTYIKKTSDTQVDPNKLYVDSNGTVQTNVQPSDLANLYENTFKLDANSPDAFPAGLTSTIAVNCASINGYGATIINLAGSTVNLITNNSQSLTISQLAFLNINAENVYFIYETYPVTYYKCIFSGRMKNSANSRTKMFGSTGYHHSTFTSCAKNVEIDGFVDMYNIGTNSDGAVLEYCRVELHIKNNPASGGTLHAQAINTYFTGDCEEPYTFGFSSGSAYSVIEVAAESGTLSLDWYDTPITLVLVNTDVFKGYFSPTRFTAVDTETLTDAAALDALGFPIQT